MTTTLPFWVAVWVSAWPTGGVWQGRSWDRRGCRRRRRGGRSEADRELTEPAQHQPVTVAPAQLGGVDGEPHGGESAVQGGEGDAGLHPGQRCTEAEVDAVAEGEVAAVGAPDVEQLRIAVAGRISVRGRQRDDHLRVRGND